MNYVGQNLSKVKLSEGGDRAGSIVSVYGKQASSMGQGGGRLNLNTVANAMNDGNGGGEAPFRVQFKTPPGLSQPNMPVLQLREVSFRWSGQTIDLWSDVTMTAHMGQRIALLGANGQGKSTLVDVMRGVLSPRVGEVIFGHGVEVSRNHEFCIKNEELCLKNEDLCLKNEEFLLQMMIFAVLALLAAFGRHATTGGIAAPVLGVALPAQHGDGTARRVRIVQRPRQHGDALKVRAALGRAEGSGCVRGGGACFAAHSLLGRAYKPPGHDDYRTSLTGDQRL